MEVKPTFFSLAGYLTPGLVFSGTSSILYVWKHPELLAKLSQLLAPLKGSGQGTTFGIAVIVSFVVAGFVTGSVCSELFVLLARRLFFPKRLRQKLRQEFQTLHGHVTLESLLSANRTQRESFVYMQTGGLDLNWSAGRARMLGGSGVALLFCVIEGIFTGYEWKPITCLAVASATFSAIAYWRSYQLDLAIARTSALLALWKRGTEPDVFLG